MKYPTVKLHLEHLKFKKLKFNTMNTKALAYINDNLEKITMWVKTTTGINVYCKGGKIVIFEKV